jgi:anti-anti-sigma factor
LLVTERREKATVIRVVESALLEGEAVSAVAKEFARQLEHDGNRQVILNCSAVETFSSDLLAKLVSFLKRVRAQGGQFVLCEVPPALGEALERTRLTSLFTIYPDEVEALRVLTH